VVTGSVIVFGSNEGIKASEYLISNRNRALWAGLRASVPQGEPTLWMYKSQSEICGTADIQDHMSAATEVKVDRYGILG
jgi:hypothetical protein